MNCGKCIYFYEEPIAGIKKVYQECLKLEEMIKDGENCEYFEETIYDNVDFDND